MADLREKSGRRESRLRFVGSEMLAVKIGPCCSAQHGVAEIRNFMASGTRHSNRLLTRLAGSNTNRVSQLGDEDFAVANLAGLGGA